METASAPSLAAANRAMTPQQSLTLSFNAESLMFAAFAVSYNLAQPTGEDRHPFYEQDLFAYVIAAAAESAGRLHQAMTRAAARPSTR